MATIKYSHVGISLRRLHLRVGISLRLLHVRVGISLRRLHVRVGISLRRLQGLNKLTKTHEMGIFSRFERMGNLL